MKCMRCGHEMTSTTGGNEVCNACGLSINDLVYRGNDQLNINAEKDSIKNNDDSMYGWICPICGRGLSPYTSICPCKNNSNITYLNENSDNSTTTVPEIVKSAYKHPFSI